MAKLISQINRHAFAPDSGFLIEGEDPNGPESVWFTIGEMLAANAGAFTGPQGPAGPQGPPGPLTLGQVLALLG